MRFLVRNVETLAQVGDPSIPITVKEPATGAVYVRIDYSVTNLTTEPVDTNLEPKMSLVTPTGVHYGPNPDAELDDRLTHQATQSSGMAAYNPGVAVPETAIFEVPLSTFDAATWRFELQSQARLKALFARMPH